MAVEVEHVARQAILEAVRARGWTVADCVKRLAAVGLPTSKTSVQRFRSDPARRLALDEWAAWALALSLPPADLLAPVPESGTAERHRAHAVREWLAGREPLPEVAEPERYRGAVLGRTWTPSQFALTLRRLADAYDAVEKIPDPKRAAHARLEALATINGWVSGALTAALTTFSRVEVDDDGLDITDYVHGTIEEE